ncbi:MAG: histidinol-phosphate transaminase [Mitsuaria chitosanitabida]|uniref:histidinol-phosphate transaminase n=1 Tax=Roseateles chitosanitabidus TaxID=65048 RepID=UPI001B23C1A4|nr:histidinol-phosphate transaminase [Roseateles chitosanitabidus]MBO9686055.1 histidinol-phosphate transaminase [Roseateles chitosanitabidus]
MKAALDRALNTLRADVRAMRAYQVHPAAGLIKLDAMENPYRLPEALQQALGERLGRVAINRYPGERTGELARALAAHAKLPEGQGLMLGNGSDELISLLAMAVCRPGERVAVLAPLPGFVMYELSSKYQHLDFVGVPLTPDFELDEAAMLAAIERERPAIVYLAYPNNPTANLWDEAVIERIAAASPGLVVIDEAYQPFAERDAMGLMARHANVLIMRTMSKFGLAGVRIGYLMGHAELIGHIDKLRPPYNISVLNAEAGLFALEHAEVYERQAAELRAERERLQAALKTLPGVTSFPSQGNMILVRVPDADALHAELKSRGVLVKNVSGMHPLLARCLRLTVGTPDENAVMLEALRAALT